AEQIAVASPREAGGIRFSNEMVRGSITGIPEEWRPGANPALRVRGGRREALRILGDLGGFKEYAKTRDFPARPTTGLSAHIKFGTVSLREVYAAACAALGRGHVLIRELYWHDFFTQIGWHFPHVFGHAFQRRYEKLGWREDEGMFQAWCEGRTGFPIVDAGMRELNTTGFMHNRVRMIVASFLVKDLWIDWRWGERYFAQRLVDYDPCVNNGNWQWAASTGCDAQPYFRVFNPWLQQRKFDGGGEYIRRWVPELAGLTLREIHTPGCAEVRARRGYPMPICDHGEASRLAKARFERVREL
ncbi:MAG: FAD-binding domain-containing protein, partial [bacterium]|nr:FAD-binding domain-containing protein [bacterium]